MKIIRKVSAQEMQALHPDFMAAFAASVDEVEYCDFPCDGLRLKGHLHRCWQCGQRGQPSEETTCRNCRFYLEHPKV
jgi:hypothetical protein